MKLYIGNKNYSSWSMRPWLVLKHFQLPFEEVIVPFDDFHQDQAFKMTMSSIGPTAKVPALVDGHLYVWDSLAICEYLRERYPEQNLWLSDVLERARARSLCAEMHSGFTDLRRLCGPTFSVADAFFAPVVMRFVTYGLAVSDQAQQ